jgi:hypothetical protein
MRPYSGVEIHQRFGGTFCFHLQNRKVSQWRNQKETEICYGLDYRRIGVRIQAGARVFLFSVAFTPALGLVQCMKLTTHLQLASKLRMSGANLHSPMSPWYDALLSTGTSLLKHKGQRWRALFSVTRRLVVLCRRSWCLGRDLNQCYPEFESRPLQPREPSQCVCVSISWVHLRLYS